MIYKDKTIEELTQALLKLQQKYDSLKSLYDSGMTKCKKTEEMFSELKKSQRFAHVGNWKLDLQTKIFMTSEEWLHIFSFPIGSHPKFEQVTDCIHPEDLERVCEKLEQSLQNRENYTIEYRIFNKEKGNYRNILSVSEIQYGSNNKPISVTGIHQDITDLKEAERKVKLLSRGIDQSPVTVVITNLEGNIEYVNPKFTKVTGYKFDEVKGKSPRILQSGKHNKEFYKELWDTILAGKEWSGEFQNKKKNGDTYWESAIISSILDNQGEISYFVGVKEDITEKKKMIEDLIYAKEKAEESDKLKTAFLNNISHEIRTPFNGILGFLSTLQNDDLTSIEKGECFSIINTSSNRLMDTINNIVEISQIQAGQIKQTPSDTNIKKMSGNLFDHFKAKAEQKGCLLIANFDF